MAALFRSATRHPRQRLENLRLTAEPAEAAAVEADEHDHHPVGGGPTRSDTARGGRLVQRWLPASAAGGRFDLVRVELGRGPARALAAVALLAAVVAGVLVWQGRPVPEPAPAPSAAVPASQASDSTELVVSVAGQVANPGLVRLAPGSRVADAVAAAGGPLPGTDLTGVNLARRLTDGEHVVVGPAAPPAAGPGAGSSAGSGARLDLNTATLAELDALPGVGPVTAQRILDWRSEHGRFASVDQLREIEGIGETRFARLKDLVLV